MRTITDRRVDARAAVGDREHDLSLAVGVRSFTRGGVASSIHSLNEKGPATDRERVSKTTS